MSTMVSTQPQINLLRRLWQSGWALVALVACARLLLFIIWGPNYGYSRDELYYLACGRHPAWGYVDQPPMIGWISWIIERTVGTSLYAIRLAPMLAGIATIILAGMLARELGGRRTAMFLTSLAVFFGPAFLALTHVLSMNAFDFPLWTLIAYLLVRVINSANERLWIAIGAVTGVAALNKYGIAFLWAGFFVGIIFSPLRRRIRSCWFWLGVLTTVVIVLPNFIWQLENHYPFLQLMRNIQTSGRNIHVSPLAFMADQATLMGWAASILAISGILFSFSHWGRRYSLLPLAFVVLNAEMILLNGKGPYVSPAYPMMLACGAVFLEQLTKRTQWVRATVGCLIAGIGCVGAPLAFPMLPPQVFMQYTRILGVEQPRYENQPRGALPQFYADMFGWEDRVRLIADYFYSLPEEEQRKTVVFASNYGDAGAVDLFGPQYGLPSAISTHQNYWNWGPGRSHGESLILMGGFSRVEYARRCASLTTVAKPNHPLARPDANTEILHCRMLSPDLQTSWATMRQLN